MSRMAKILEHLGELLTPVLESFARLSSLVFGTAIFLVWRRGWQMLFLKMGILLGKYSVFWGFLVVMFYFFSGVYVIIVGSFAIGLFFVL